jgi:hypothetical protein
MNSSELANIIIINYFYYIDNGIVTPSQLKENNDQLYWFFEGWLYDMNV